MKVTTLTIFLTLLCLSTHAKFEWNENCRSAYTAAIDLKFEISREIIKTEILENPENSLVFLIENYIDYLIVQIGEEQSDFEHLKGNKDVRLTVIEKDQTSSPWQLYSQAEIHIHWSANRLKFGDYIIAAYDIRKAYKLLEKNQQLYPNFLPNKKSLGLLYCLLGSVPKQYQWILSIAGMNGDLNQGFDLLEKAISKMKKDPYFSSMLNETQFLYSFLKMNLDNNNDELLKLLDDIKNSDNILLRFAASRLASKTAQNDLAIDILENRDKSADFYSFLYLEYLTGVGKLNKLNNDCLIHFNKYLNEFEGQNYKKSTLMRMSWHAYINNDISAYTKYKREINTTGALQIDADKEAQSYFNSKRLPNKTLLKARLYFDGGYFSKALDELKQFDKNQNVNVYDELDFYYRLGRTHEQLDNTNTAINFYKIALEKGAQKRYFFAAKSALRLALIYERNYDYDQAKKYFNKTIELKDHLYEQSIEQKAKGGLERIN